MADLYKKFILKKPTPTKSELISFFSELTPLIPNGWVDLTPAILDEKMEFSIVPINEKTDFANAFTWFDKEKMSKIGGLKKLSKHIVTYHTFGAPAFFKPSLEEIYHQIPEEYVDLCVKRPFFMDVKKIYFNLEPDQNHQFAYIQTNGDILLHYGPNTDPMMHSETVHIGILDFYGEF
jgi:hypothetical protein